MWWGRAANRIVASALVLMPLGGCEAARVVTVGPGPDCSKVQVAAVLHVDPADPHQVWATDLASEQVLAVRPRPGLGWRVDPASDPGRLVDRGGMVATFEGEIFRQACFDALSDTYDVGPEDLPDPDRPPN
jgi:hypothetical protein